MTRFKNICLYAEKKYPSGNIGVIVVEKTNGKMKELATIGIAQNQDELGALLSKGREWIDREQERWHKNPQIILGLLVSIGGYQLAYCIHEGDKYGRNSIGAWIWTRRGKE